MIRYSKVTDDGCWGYLKGEGWVAIEPEPDFEPEIRKRERLLEIMASERVYNQDVREDAIQEGRIAIWSVLRKDPTKPAAYINKAAAYRIGETSSRQTWTGHTRSHGQPTDPLRNSAKASLDDEAFELGLLEAAGDLLAGVEMAYHHGEIVQAINALPKNHRQYVVLRFWGGYTNPEIAALQEVSKATVERSWRESIRPMLLSHLHHLQDAL